MNARAMITNSLKEVFSMYVIVALFILKRKGVNYWLNDAVIGLDAVTMVVSGKCPKQIEQRVEKRNKQGQLYLRVDKTKQRDTYNVTIVLPSIIRPTNIRGFSLLDSVKLEYVIDVVKQDLQEILGTNNLEQLIVKKLENGTSM